MHRSTEAEAATAAMVASGGQISPAAAATSSAGRSGPRRRSTARQGDQAVSQSLPTGLRHRAVTDKVQYIVDDLECQAQVVAEDFQRLNLADRA